MGTLDHLAPAVRYGPTVPRHLPYGLAGLVREQAQRDPEAVAAMDGDGTLTYRQLEVESDVVARELAASGARPGDPVAVRMPRGRTLLVALLGAVKAGMPYLPLAPDDPPARRAAVIDDARPAAALVVAGTSPVPGVSATVPVDLGHPDLPWDDLAARDEQHPVYVMYTSGSTGRPKGVVVPVLALANRLLWMREHYALGPTDRGLQKAPVTFDASAYELWAPLVSGGRVVLLPPDAHRDPAMIIDWIVGHGVTWCHFVPSMLAEFLRWPGAARCRSLRVVYCGGETLTPGLVRRFQEVLPVPLHNQYGPTETTIDVSVWPCPRPADDLDIVLIGTPIANCALLVLDEAGEVVRGDAVGELAVGGMPLATGYLNHPDLTRRAFVAGPAGTGLDRVYRTGDLARRVGDAIEHLGRRDGQLKVRGQRLEATEVEDALLAVAWVRDAAVVVAASTLWAYVVVDEGSGHDEARVATDLGGRLRETLPTVFVPDRYVVVDELPVTGSGKRDRALLTRWAADAASPGTADAASPGTVDPGTGGGRDAAGFDGERSRSDEDELARLWERALGRPTSVDTGFLDAGGHSLAAVRVCGEVLHRWGARLPLSLLLRDNATLADLRDRLPDPAVAPVGVARRADPSVADLSPEQRRLWLHHQVFPGMPAYNVVGVLRAEGRFERRAVERAWHRLVLRHETLRTTVEDSHGEPRQRIHPMEPQRLVVGPDGADLASFVTRLADTVFRPDALPRAVLGLHHGDSGDALVLVVDHLVADQRTLDLLQADLAAGYALPGTGAEDGTSAVQYGDVIAGARSDLQRHDRDRAYWRHHLAGAPATLDLPFRAPRPSRPSFRGRHVDVDLGAGLDSWARAHRWTPAAVALAAFVRVLADWAGVDDLCVGVPASGRESPAAHAATGFFMRTLPLRLRVPAQATTADLLPRVTQALHDGIEHGSVPFDEIVDLVGARRDLTHNPVFQVWFNDLTQDAPPASIGGVPVTPVPPDVRWSLFDLGLYLSRRPTGGYRLRLVYATDLWGSRAAAEFLDQCRAELDMLATASPPGPTPAVLPGSTPTEPTVSARAAPPSYDAVVRRILRHAARNPARPAIVSGQRVVTYGALVERARRAAGVASTAPDGLIAVRAARHPDLAAVVLGCWLAGRGPLLLDATLPANWADAARAAAGATVTIDVGLDPLDGPPAPGPPATPGPLGHALVTSGTTGAPAVVTLPADCLPEAFDEYARALGLTREDSFCFTTPPAHDPMFRDLLLPLWLGASVRVPSADLARQPPRLLGYLAEARTTILHTTPAQARLLTAAAGGRQLPHLRHLVLHGELSGDADARAARRLAPEATVYDLYGTTETPQAAHLARWDVTTGRRTGVPLNHRSTQIRTARGPARVGVVGELVVTGRGLALGYLGDTPRRAPEPTGAGRRYPTGDLGRRDLDGAVRILGRRDRQVTVNGHRIELDGIERELTAVPGIRNCAVARTEAGIVAWYAADPRPGWTDPRAVLATRLPAWSIPTAFVRMEELPMTHNGKIDRAALPDPAGQARDVAAPSSPAELADRIASRATDILGEHQPGRRVGPDTKFFEAGLTSLDLVRLRQALVVQDGLRVDVVDLFECPTPRDLALSVGRPTTRTGRPRRPSRNR
ncbi:amino acid adenylation domain-containing protein [Plantactinospora sp. GCM10030261]|uniref:amino acid adenylation domain-containing protein n=1 Tax=Plantactinospora sp. GCM10030261 TaxID=3273420 RepID=UPI00360704B6